LCSIVRLGLGVLLRRRLRLRLGIGGLGSIGGVGLIGRRGRRGLEGRGWLFGFLGEGSVVVRSGMGVMGTCGLGHWLEDVTIADVMSNDWSPIQHHHILASFHASLTA